MDSLTINRVANHSAPTSPSRVNRSARTKPVRTTCQKAQTVALYTLLAVISLIFMFFQPPLFFTGLIVGVVLKDTILKMIEKIGEVFRRQPWKSIGVTTLATIFAFPVILMAGAFFTGGYLGIRFSDLDKKTPRSIITTV